jgi:hypothetical protein
MSDELRLISLPFHNGLPSVGMGIGAARLAEDSMLSEAIESEGWRVAAVEIEPVDSSLPEIARVIELTRRLARAVGKRGLPRRRPPPCSWS